MCNFSAIAPWTVPLGHWRICRLLDRHSPRREPEQDARAGLAYPDFTVLGGTDKRTVVTKGSDTPSRPWSLRASAVASKYSSSSCGGRPRQWTGGVTATVLARS